MRKFFGGDILGFTLLVCLSALVTTCTAKQICDDFNFEYCKLAKKVNND